MLTRIQALNYRCFNHIDQSLGNFQVLVGANGVGKSTFLDVICFLGELVRQPRGGLQAALNGRSASFEDLLFEKKEGFFELAIEAEIPEKIASESRVLGHSGIVRLEVRIGFTNTNRSQIGVLSERLVIRRSVAAGSWIRRDVRRQDGTIPERNDRTIMEAADFSLIDDPEQAFSVVSMGKDIALYQFEGIGDVHTPASYRFDLGNGNSALANLPEDSIRFPVATWFRGFLAESVVNLVLEPEKLRRPAPVGYSAGLNPNGANLPFIIASFSEEFPDQYADWVAHLHVALPDLASIRTIERPEDRHRYLVVEYTDGRVVPSWLVSDGTLRLIGLTLPAYAMDHGGIFLIEEPENGIHPLAIEIVMQSLNSMYESQVIVTTHSPAILSLTSPENILCFSKSSESGTTVVRGDLHPRMSAWKGTVDPGMLLASGILG